MKQACFLPIECAFFGFKFDKNRLVNIYKVYIKISKNRVFCLSLPRAANQNLNRIRECSVQVFLLQKFRCYLRFSAVGVPSFRAFRGSYGCVRIALSVAVADGFIPRKVRGRWKGVYQA